MRGGADAPPLASHRRHLNEGCRERRKRAALFFDAEPIEESLVAAEELLQVAEYLHPVFSAQYLQLLCRLSVDHQHRLQILQVGRRGIRVSDFG